jgi:hypothetical protein
MSDRCRKSAEWELGELLDRRRMDVRKRFAMLLLCLTALAVLIPASPASATTCYIEDPGVDEVKCLVYGTPIAGPLCVKLSVC